METSRYCKLCSNGLRGTTNKKSFLDLETKSLRDYKTNFRVCGWYNLENEILEGGTIGQQHRKLWYPCGGGGGYGVFSPYGSMVPKALIQALSSSGFLDLPHILLAAL